MVTDRIGEEWLRLAGEDAGGRAGWHGYQPYPLDHGDETGDPSNLAVCR